MLLVCVSVEFVCLMVLVMICLLPFSSGPNHKTKMCLQNNCIVYGWSRKLSFPLLYLMLSTSNKIRKEQMYKNRGLDVCTVVCKAKLQYGPPFMQCCHCILLWNTTYTSLTASKSWSTHSAVEVICTSYLCKRNLLPVSLMVILVQVLFFSLAMAASLILVFCDV